MDENKSATATTEKLPSPRDRHGWESVAQKAFGPRTELFRASSHDRNRRFVVAQSLLRTDGSKKADVVVLGEADSYAKAVMLATTSDTGRAAIAEHVRAVELMKKALGAKSPIEFADAVETDAISELRLSGATEDQIQAIKEKFTKAKEKINDDHGSESN